jgi:hypothetical protein
LENQVNLLPPFIVIGLTTENKAHITNNRGQQERTNLLPQQPLRLTNSNQKPKPTTD